MLINFAAGGPTDIEGRLFAKYLGRHIAGQPTVIVQNMDGAGGVVGAQFVGEVAPKDGTVMGYFAGTSWIYVSDPERWRVDFKSYEFVAYTPGTTVHFVRTDVAPGMRTPADIVKAQGLIAGGLSIDTSKDLRLRLGLDMLGVPFKYVTGYRSSPPARLALQRGEINMFSESPPSYRAVVVPALVDKGQAIPVWWDDVHEGDNPAPQKQMEGLSIPTLPAAPSPDQRRQAVGPAVGGLQDAVRGQLDAAAADRAAAGRAARRLRRAQPGDRAAEQRQGFCRRGDEGDPVHAGISDRARHEQARPRHAGRVAGDDANSSTTICGTFRRGEAGHPVATDTSYHRRPTNRECCW